MVDSDIIIATLNFPVIIALLGLWIAVENSLDSWKFLLKNRSNVSDNIKSIINSGRKSQKKEHLLYISRYIYYDDIINGEGFFRGSMSFLYGLWRCVLTPLCAFFLPIYVYFTIAFFRYGLIILAYLLFLTVIACFYYRLFAYLANKQSFRQSSA